MKIIITTKLQKHAINVLLASTMIEMPRNAHSALETALLAILLMMLFNAVLAIQDSSYKEQDADKIAHQMLLSIIQHLIDVLNAVLVLTSKHPIAHGAQLIAKVAS